MLFEFDGKRPKVAKGAFVAPTAQLIGDVTVEEGASIWFGAVLRGDFGPIVVGARTSIQDNCVVHVTNSGCYIGEDVTVGHGAILHNCHVKRGSVIGMNAVVLDDANVGEESIVAAGSVVSAKATIPDRVLVAGIPAQVKKPLEGASLWWVNESAKTYVALKDKYLSLHLNDGGQAD
ncbi:gamma carbonic anhydrase family protein [Effusibacillus lacus]|uniref:Gamma carbonic anhydrase family protein n=1 Tax=Effusibacillus lacus TaxID=1348429 RepID=A0A292YM08_9BACL|nr:gamma carbonic anhydrase family protein [Effusibacillus lacus]TCS75372.1 carbonic anhydrase/acetyltransferase-like protein (isoleucine patch superfamily) [Effusibacillus lacus]GAX89803.1 gamma carbonic anhydrase family protein [Effusibacillus lacus]